MRLVLTCKLTPALFFFAVGKYFPPFRWYNTEQCTAVRPNLEIEHKPPAFIYQPETLFSWQDTVQIFSYPRYNPWQIKYELLLSDISSVSYVDCCTIKILSTTLRCFSFPFLFSCTLQHPDTPVITTESKQSDSVGRLLLFAVSHSHMSRQLIHSQIIHIIYC